MSTLEASEPSEDDLFVFAQQRLAGLGRLARNDEAVRQSVREARELWLMLHRVERGAG